jgi:hypothetical protein
MKALQSTLHEAFFIEANIINLCGLPKSLLFKLYNSWPRGTMFPGQNCEAFVAHSTHKILGC